MSQPLADSRHYTMKLGANDAGGMTVTTNGNSAVLTVGAGSITDIGVVKRILATGTTATGVVPLYGERA